MNKLLCHFKLVVIACFMFPALISAQLTGTYTINGAVATGGTNYQTFTAAVSSLITSGVSGAVVFNVAAGTYNEQISIPNITGVSAIKTITFKGLGDLTKITAAPSTSVLPVIGLDSASHIIIDSLKIEVTGLQGFGVHLMNHTDTVLIKSCHIMLPQSNDCYGIIGSGSIASASSSTVDGEYITIQNNTIEGGNTSIHINGATGPLTVPNKQVNYGNGLYVIGNTMLDFANKAMTLNNNHNVDILNNYASTSQSASNGAISLWDAGDNQNVIGNSFYINSNAANTRVIAISMAPANGPAGNSALPMTVANNFVQYAGSNTTTPTGILVKNKGYIKIYNNTIKVSNQGSTANCIWLDANSTRNLDGNEIRNNVMVLENSGSGYFIYNAANGASFKNMLIDHNNYYCEGSSTYFKSAMPNGTSGVANYTSFAAYLNNTIGYGTGALNVDPEFLGTTDLHASSVLMNDSGVVITGITTDIDGDLRSLTTPDMGADEYNPPSCPKAVLLNTSNVTATSVDLSFVSNGTKFVVEYGPSGFTQGTGLIDTVFATTATIVNLNSNTAYDFYVLNDCTDSLNGFSYWAGPVTATTLCSFTNYYFTNWDGLISGQSDNCWTFSGTASSSALAYAPSLSYSLQPYSGNNFYRIYNSTSTTNYLISPEITSLDSNILQLRFQGSSTYTGTVGTPNFIVGTLDSIANPGSFTAIDTVFTTSNSWTEFTVVLNNVPAGHKYVVIKHGNNANYVYMGIDDLYIESQPACIPPSNATAAGITDTSAIITWSPGDGSTWEIEYGPLGFAQGTGTHLTGLTSSTDTLNGLSPNTCYSIYIKGNCTFNNSTWFGPIDFCTLCAVIAAPYAENFDGSTWTTGTGSNNIGDALDDCWSRTPALASAFRWGVRTGTTASASTGPNADVSTTGNYLYTESSYGSSANNAEVFTPTIDFSALTQPTLSFSYHRYGATMGKLFVTVLDSNQYDTLLTLSGQQQTSGASPWVKVYVDLTAYKNMPRKIRFVGQRGTSITGDMAIDEVSIDELPSCLLPSAFALTNVTATTASFNWSTITNNTAFVVEYGPAGYTQGTGVGTQVNMTGTTGTLTGLNVKTSYDAYLADACDTTMWLGPITFTTLIDDDARVTAILSPVNGSCGDSTYTIEVKVKNAGLNTINSLPVYVDITGAATASINTTYTTSIAPGAFVNVVVGTVNLSTGGLVDVSAYTSLLNDQDNSNDTLTVTGIELISPYPMHLPMDTLCANDTSGMFVAIPQTGIVHNWYYNVTDTIPFATGDTIGAMPGQTVYLDRSKENDKLIFDATTGSLYGNMVKLYITSDMLFTGFTFESATSGNALPIAFYKQGAWRGHETNRNSWTVIDSASITGVASLGWYTLNFSNPVQFSAGDTISLYIANKLGTKIKAQGLRPAVDSIGDLFVVTSDFELYAGVGGAYFGANMVTAASPASVSYEMHWNSLDICGNNRIPLTMGLNNDTAFASFFHTIHANGADVDFDASASTGHLFDWDFGDGATGTGKLTSHTYTAGGSYTVILTVTDTVCGTADSTFIQILPTVSINESLLNRTLKVYPNPNNGEFVVSFELEGIQEVSLTLLNAIGQQVYSEDLGSVAGHVQHKINMSNLAEGIYVLQITAAGKQSFVKLRVY